MGESIADNRDLWVCHSRMQAEVLYSPRYPSHFIMFPWTGVMEERAWSIRREVSWLTSWQTCAAPQAACLGFACCCGEGSEGERPRRECSRADPPCRTTRSLAAQLGSGWQ